MLGAPGDGDHGMDSHDGEGQTGRLMRPISLAVQSGPAHTETPEEHFYEWQVVVANGGTEACVVRIPRTVRDRAHSEPDTCGPGVVKAVKTEGRSVVEQKILKQDDPPLKWVVHVDDIFKDVTSPE